MRVALGSIVWREETVEFSQSMRSLLVKCEKNGITVVDFTVKGDALVSRARSIVASAFVRSNADVLLMIDSDIQFRSEDALKLCREALQKDVVGALYMTRNVQTQPALMLPNEPVTFADGQEPVEVPYLSTGFMAVSRRVFLRLKQDLPLCHRGWNDRGQDTSFWPFYLPMVIPNEVEGNYYLSEDWAFCHRAKEAGFRTWLDPSIRLGHVGTYVYQLEDLLRPNKLPPQPLILSRSEDGGLTTTVVSHEIERELVHG